MAQTCSHQDESRRAVSSTAHMVAYCRSLEPKVHQDNALFVDPYAEALALNFGQTTTTEMTNGDEKWTPVQRRRFLDMISTRTKCIDDFVVENINNCSIDQICVLGAGLDTRPWRLNNQFAIDPQNIKYIEIDFVEVFDFKLSVLQEQQAETKFHYEPLTADLSLTTWPTLLIEKGGFNPNLRTLWIMEGFVNYLKEEELRQVLTIIEQISAIGSRLIATSITTATRSTLSYKNLHQYFPDRGIDIFLEYGWNGTEDDCEDLATFYGRSTPPGEERRGYVIVRLQK
jgi:methyltransferase (TIGR00027 family)